MKDEEYLSPLERVARDEKRYRRWEIRQHIATILALLIIAGLLIIGIIKGFF